MSHPSISALCHSPLPFILKERPINQGLLDSTSSTLPPTKRRKLKAACSDSEVRGADADDRVPLYLLDIDISFDTSQNVKQASKLDSSEAVECSEVIIQEFVQTRPQHYRCDLLAESGVTRTICLKATIPPQTLKFLQRALRYQRPGRHKSCKSKFSMQSLSGYACRLRLEITWINAQSLEEASSNSENDILAFILNHRFPEASEAWSPRDFYESVHVPSRESNATELLIVDGLESTLFPYQRRTVEWMLTREGADLQGQSLMSTPSFKDGDHGFFSMVNRHQNSILVNPWLGLVTRDGSLADNPVTKVRGGILAEEMGLGKTVQCLAVILQHRRPAFKMKQTERASKQQEPPRKINATLIIAPESIIAQWNSEVNMHAPSLRTFVYPGVAGGFKAPKGRSEEELVERISESDIVLASYHTISREIHFTEPPPERSLRFQKVYARKRSPLVQVEWWRCILDECQMVESGVSNAAKVANQIPRVLAWAVSGTPLRKDSGDLWGLLVFLRLGPYCWSLKLWNRLLDYHKPTFRRLCGTIVLRHTKNLVKDDIQLPPQKRIVVTVPLTQIEAQHYSNMFEIMCNQVGLDSDGGPIQEDWDPNDPEIVEKMRRWLTQLRQICLHPQIGERNRRALGQLEQGTLRTIEQVLEVMTAQNEAELHNQERAYLILCLRRGQLLENAQRSPEALAVWQDALPNIQRVVRSARGSLEKASESPEELTDAAKTAKLGPLRNRLRLTLEIEHMATFFIANAYFQIKTNEELTVPDSDDFRELERTETQTYEAAKLLRRELLNDSQHVAEVLMTTIKSRVKEVVKIPEIPEFEVVGGIETRGIPDRIDEFCYALNKQAEKLNEWRSTLADLLSKPLVDQEEQEVQGDEYEISMKQQDEVYVYMDCFRAIVADRKDVMTGQVNTLIQGETADLMARARTDSGHFPKLMIEMLKARDAVKPPKHLGSMRGLLAELRSKKTNLKTQEETGNSRIRTEIRIIDIAIQQLQKNYQLQTRLAAEVEKDVNTFSDAQNARLEYYRQLQHISDSVATHEKEYSEANYAFLESSERKLKAQIERLESRARYLDHLRNVSSAGSERRRCIICQEEKYEQGVLTSCGHTFCSACINQWLRQSSRCPTCKKILKKKDFHQITYKPQDLQMEEEENDPNSGSPSSSSPTSGTRNSSSTPSSIYSQISTHNLNQIKSIDLPESFSTKIDIIARHILWLRHFEPGAKTVLFSQYQSFCPTHLAYAFRQLTIRFAVVGNKGGVERFKHDPAVECLLMHAGSQASGLNLVNATHVLLCEPLVNTAIELQAIARVHRIGQHRPTTVWMYLVEGTVEKAIYDLSVRRRLAHIGTDQSKERRGKGKDKASMGAEGEAGVTEDKVEAVDAAQMQDNPLARVLKKGSEGGEIVGKDDLWTCLFGSKQAPRANAVPALEGGDQDENAGEEDEEGETDLQAGEAAGGSAGVVQPGRS